MERIQNRLIHTGAQALRRIGYDFHEREDERVQELQRTLQALEGGAVNFEVQTTPDGEWAAESTNINGIITGGDDPRRMNEILKDAIFTYFEIPPHLCQDYLLRAENEPVTAEQRVRIGG
jgi:predicted RNase H-like HicB family nuclease